ncbi:lipid kinase YegS [Thalassotalea agarivorans]|nr:lipid kinase YegS [Thalassotalea agarivorans]
MANPRLILNGKKAGLALVRQAIFFARESVDIDVRVTFEAGDVERFVCEAVAEGVTRIIAGGGDGTVNEVVNALMKTKNNFVEVGIFPLGTANDFARSLAIPEDLGQALTLAATASVHDVDTVQINDDYFLNVASCGFGAEVTANTPVALKNFLGGGAYTLSGLVQALNFTPFKGKITFDECQIEDEVIVAALCNGRQAGGGQLLAPDAKINDGLIDVVSMSAFALQDINQVVSALLDNKESNAVIKRFQTAALHWQSESAISVNLDGEPRQYREARVSVHHKALKLALPSHCPLI